MEQQRRLFPEPATTIRVAKSCGEPRLWVRRLVLWANPGELIREVSLRRGLNIIWSPDPGPDAADLGAEGGSGHGAGKTLFCRLLRYCLGEDAFANDDLHQRIVLAFPEGLVGAEVVVAGTTWGVVRPLGMTRKVRVGEGPPEKLLASESRGTGMDPLLDRITQALLRDAIDEYMPGTKEWKSWLLALAWLARDQECRFGHILEWRHAAADSRSPASGLSKESHLVAARLLLGAISADEIATREKLTEREAERQRLEREVSYLTVTAGRSGRSLAIALGAEPSVLTAESLAAAGIEGTAQNRLLAAEERLNTAESDDDVGELRAALQDILEQMAVIRELQQRTQGLIDIQQEHMRALRGERANLDAEDIKARLGHVCPVCFVPIDEALAKGCGLSHVIPDRDQIAQDSARVVEQLRACGQAVERYRQQLDENGVVLGRLHSREAHVCEQLRGCEERARNLRARRRQDWLIAAKAAEDASRLKHTYSELEVTTRKIAAIEADERCLKQELQAHREHHASTLARMNELFGYICRAMLGATTESSLALTGQGFRADVQVGGTAMESLKAVAFDVAAMLMSIEGRTSLPALLVHDSPREADLGVSHYHRLFRFMARLEAVGAEPAFQYIITTTTDPPEEMINTEAVVLCLQGREPTKRLLKRDL